MAKFIIIIEDEHAGNPEQERAHIQVLRQMRVGEDDNAPSQAARMARYLEMKVIELEKAIEHDKAKRTEAEQGAARCWH